MPDKLLFPNNKKSLKRLLAKSFVDLNLDSICFSVDTPHTPTPTQSLETQSLKTFHKTTFWCNSSQ